MKLTTILSISMLLLSAQITATPISPAACKQWKNGKCTEGGLTELAKSLNGSSINMAERSSICDQVCKEACPKCHMCDLCDLCDFYDDAACHDVPYYVDRETCNIEKTNSCCKLCEVQCHNDEGVCGSKGYCQNKTQTAGTDILTLCVERTTEYQCLPCTGN